MWTASGSVKSAAQIETKLLDTILEQARVLMSERNQVAMVATRQQMKKSTVERRKMVCFECGGDHLVKVCKERKLVTCWKCGESGHISQNCMAGKRIWGIMCTNNSPAGLKAQLPAVQVWVNGTGLPTTR